MNSLVLVLDWESSGLRDEKSTDANFIEGPQGIQIGAIVVDPNNDWKEIDHFESNVRFIGKHKRIIYGSHDGLTWSEDAERIHGLTIKSLIHAPVPSTVGHNFVSWLSKYFDPDDSIMMAGHNPFSVDRYHTLQLLWFSGLSDSIKLHHMMLDTATLGYFVWGNGSSSHLFDVVLGANRKEHNALEDARLCNGILRKASKYITLL